MVLKVRGDAGSPAAQLVNALRGHAAEFGVIAAKGIRQIPPLLEAIAAETAIPSDAREMLRYLARKSNISTPDSRRSRPNSIAMHKANPISRLLATIPGIGPPGRADPGNRRIRLTFVS